MEMNMFEKMQQLPFLQGLSLNSIQDILTFLKLDFNTYEENETIVHQGEQCNRLIYIIDGEFEVEYRSNTESYIFSEISTDCPHAIEAYNLFSIKRKYDHTYTFRSKGATFTISKDALNSRLLDNRIIRSNFINYLSNQTSKGISKSKFHLSSDIELRVAMFIRSNCMFDRGEKILRIKMEDLADLIDETRLNVSKVLNKWDSIGLIEQKRQNIHIPDIEKLPR